MNETSCRAEFCNTLLELARENKDIYAFSTDARGSVGLTEFVEKLPEQFIECGIAEQNLVSTAAGFSTTGKTVFACSPACFIYSRSFEQIKVDLAYNESNVKAIGVSGGISYGALGTTHHTLNDIAVMRSVTGLRVLIPSDPRLTKKMIKAIANDKFPYYVRMGRNKVDWVYENDDFDFQVGKGNVVIDGNDLTIIACGELVCQAVYASKLLKEKGISAAVIDMHTIKPLDNELILKYAKKTKNILTVEEHSIHGGLGSSVSELLIQEYPVKMKIIGLPDENVITGVSLDVFKHYGLDGVGIAEQSTKLLEVGWDDFKS